MASVAVLIGNAVYKRENQLPCCVQDVAAMRALVEATGRFDSIHAHVDVTADEMREALRAALPADGQHDEVFFYYSGHGAVGGADLFYCGTDYDGRRPNATGLSQADLLDLLRAATPATLIMVIDACFSGALLVKDAQPLKPVSKEGLRNVLQFSSSMDNQTSMGGDRLSAFTRAFLEASLRKTEGTVYYADLVNIIRDDFLGNDDQTPFFVNQGTGREVLVDDAGKLNDVRSRLHSEWTEHDEGDVDDGDADEEDDAVREGGAVQVLAPLTPKQLLVEAEERMGTPEEAAELTNELFDGLLAALSEGDFAEFFDTSTVEHSSYVESTTREFMIRVLSRETRLDRMVTAEIKRKRKKPNPWEAASLGILAAMDAEWTELFTLELNCRLERAQFKITLTPKYRTLQQLRLVMSCAPSLERCYIFELITQHPRTDWNAFDDEGRELTRRWYKVDWDESLDGIIRNARDALEKAVRDHIESAVKRLTD